MAISSQTYTGNNSVTTFPISFDWIYVSDVIVTVDSFTKVNGTDYTIVNKNVVFTKAPSTGVVIKIARSSNLTARIVDFVNGSRLDESDLDNSAKQLFYLIQELKDQTDDVSTRITQAAAALITPNTVGNTALQADSVTLSKIANGAVSPAKLSSGGPSWTEAGVLSVTSFAGPLTGNVTGNVTGNAGSVTNGVYTTGDQTIGGVKTFNSRINASINGNAHTVDDGVYTQGNQNIDGFKTFLQPISGLLSGNVTGLIRSPNQNTYVDVSNLERRINTFDYGVINPVFMDPISYYLYAVGTDMGTFNNPSDFGIDAGTI